MGVVADAGIKTNSTCSSTRNTSVAKNLPSLVPTVLTFRSEEAPLKPMWSSDTPLSTCNRINSCASVYDHQNSSTKTQT